MMAGRQIITQTLVQTNFFFQFICSDASTKYANNEIKQNKESNTSDDATDELYLYSDPDKMDIFY